MNVVMASTGPVAYGKYVRLPYIVAGALCVIYNFAFVIYTSKQQSLNSKRISEIFTSWGEGMEEEEVNHLVEQVNNLSIASNECVARMASVILRLKEDEDNENAATKKDNYRKQQTSSLSVTECEHYDESLWLRVSIGMGQEYDMFVWFMSTKGHCHKYWLKRV